MNNVKATFGRLLPDPSYLTANFGRIDREIQFVLHPNGDIHAHQWLAQNLEWQPVGQYIYGRKVLEGILSQEPLRGQKIGSFSPQNMLQRFIAVAKQYEEASVAKAEPKGYEPGTARPSFVRPAIPLINSHPQRPPLSMDHSDPMSRSFSSAGYPSQQGGLLPTLSNLPIRQPAPTRPRPPPVFGEETYGPTKSALGSQDTRSSSPHQSTLSPLAYRKQPTPELPVFPLSSQYSFDALPPTHSVADSAQSNFRGVQSSGFRTSFQERLRMGRQVQRTKIMELDEGSDGAGSPTTISSVSKAGRSRLVQDAKEAIPPPVMKKPAQPNPFASWTFTNHTRNSFSTQGVPLPTIEPGASPNFVPIHNLYATASPSSQTSRRPTSSSMSDPRAALTHSEPEEGYTERQRIVVTSPLATGNMTDEEVKMYSRPSEQNWKGPLFTGDEEFRTDDEKLMHYWRSGDMSRRKNWTEVQGTYSSRYASRKGKEVPHFSAPQISKQQAPIGTAAAQTYGLRGSAVEWKGSAARDVAKMGW